MSGTVRSDVIPPAAHGLAQWQCDTGLATVHHQTVARQLGDETRVPQLRGTAAAAETGDGG